jgi:phosphoribosylformylglycinamidine (FGAM) synthase-like enzyme
MVVIVSHGREKAVQRAFEAEGERVSLIGEVIKDDGPRVTYRGRLAL